MKNFIFQLECGRQGGSVEGSCAQVTGDDEIDDDNHDENYDETGGCL